MKRVWWVARIAVLVAASYCIFAPGGSHMLRNVRADGESCDTSASCARTNDTNQNCYCPEVSTGGGGCKGCFIENNTPGCGTCSGGGGGGGGIEGFQP